MLDTKPSLLLSIHSHNHMINMCPIAVSIPTIPYSWVGVGVFTCQAMARSCVVPNSHTHHKGKKAYKVLYNWEEGGKAMVRDIY